MSGEVGAGEGDGEVMEGGEEEEVMFFEWGVVESGEW